MVSYPECEKCFFAGAKIKFLHSGAIRKSPGRRHCGQVTVCSILSGVRKMLFRRRKNKIFALRSH
ncbi:Uncharacterized protein dnm_097720 [Desulfonema magnum]|uniref:Uncharacterized protein n=1 Tax=Desulfonema magnum TaxID=45655 RepID=A0A975BXT8_9BACT|nr:Uncharacterized protein dnm_097720 [Desulfonema magnum]